MVTNYMKKFLTICRNQTNISSILSTNIINKRIGIDLSSNDDIRNRFIKRGFQSIDTRTNDILINNTGN